MRPTMRPISSENQRLDACTCSWKVDLGDGDRAMTEPVSHDEEIVAARFVEAHCPALPETVAGKSLRVVADHAERAFNDFFRHRSRDRFRSAVRCMKATAEERLIWRDRMFSCALNQITVERAVQFRADRHAARVTTFAFEESGWERDVRTNVAIMRDVADCEALQRFGSRETFAR